jgi:hypothetical protein
MMVPLSLLESVREEAKAQTAREDSRFAHQALLSDSRSAREALLSDSRFEEAKGRLEERLKNQETTSADKLSRALYAYDMARSKVTARALVEEAVADSWRAWERLGAEGQEQASPSPKGATMRRPPSSVTDQLKALLGFPGMAAYLQVAEEDNGLARGVLVKSAAIMYPALCTPLHARPVGAQAQQLPAEVFSSIGENGRIAFAALVAFGGRNVGMYEPCGETVPVVLRVPPIMGLSATLQQIRDSAKLPTVKVSLELGVAGGAEPSGEGVV